MRRTLRPSAAHSAQRRLHHKRAHCRTTDDDSNSMRPHSQRGTAAETDSDNAHAGNIVSCLPAAAPVLCGWSVLCAPSVVLTVRAALIRCMASLTRALSDCTLSSDGGREVDCGCEECVGGAGGGRTHNADDVRSSLRGARGHTLSLAWTRDTTEDETVWRTDMLLAPQRQSSE